MSQPDGTGPRREWPQRLISFLLGAASGTASNLFTGADAARAIAVALTVAALLTAALRLRRLAPRAPAVRWSIRLLLGLGLAGAVLTLAGPATLAPYLVFASVAVTGAAAFIPANPETRWRTLGGVAVVGLGVAAVGGGAAVLLDRTWLGGAALVGGGVAAVGLGAAVLLDRTWLGGAALVGFGVAVGGGGAAVLLDHTSLFGAAVVGVGVAIVGLGAAVLLDRTWLGGAALGGLGVAAVVGGAAVLRRCRRRRRICCTEDGGQTAPVGERRFASPVRGSVQPGV